MNEDIQSIAERLAGASVRTVMAAKTGGNSVVFRVETTAGPFALKVYPSRIDDTRNRADIEWRTLLFLTARGRKTVPLPVARDSCGRYLLMEWVNGVPVAAHQAGDIAQAADFIGEVFALSRDPEAVEFPAASEACLSAAVIIRQIERRLLSLITEPTLDRFLAQTFRPLLARAKSRVTSTAQYSVDLSPPLRRLIPADFGFHNALRQADGSLRYVDFEYFGWDDPAKLTADFLLHPAMQLSFDDRRSFTRRMVRALSDDRAFVDRLHCRLPLFALRWMLILLNPFREDRAAELSGAADEREALLRDRLAKARMLVDWVDCDTILPVTAL